MPIRAPHYAVLRGQTFCHECGQQTTVVGIAAPPEATVDDSEYPIQPGEHGWLNLTEVETLPAAVAQRLGDLGGRIRVDRSVTAGLDYVMNHCAGCDAKLGDHYLHGEPSGPFFGEETDLLEAWLVEQPLALECGYSEGPLGEWLQEKIAQIRFPMAPRTIRNGEQR